MIAALLSPRVLMILAAVAGAFALYVWGRSDGAAPVRAQLAQERAAWANERTKAAEIHAEALASEINAHNRTTAQLEAANADAENLRNQAEKSEAAAAAAASDSARSKRRMLDAAETNRLATRAAIDAAGAARVCAPAIEAIDLRDRLLADYRTKAQELGEFGREVGPAFEHQTIRARQCASAYEVTR